MRPVCWNIITQIVKKYARDTLITTTSLKIRRFGPPRTFIWRAHKSVENKKYK